MQKLCDKLINRAIRLKATPGDIKRFSINKEGRIRLQINGDSFFKNDSVLKEVLCKSQSISDVPVSCIDAIGLIVIKKFFPFFLEYLSKIGEEEYNERLVVNSHIHFTSQMCDDNIEFTFHVSILHDIMLENLNV